MRLVCALLINKSIHIHIMSIYISTYQTKLNQSILKKYDLRDYIKLLFLITHPKSSRSRASRPSAGTVAQHWAPNFPREEVVCSPLLFVRCSISLSNIIISKILGMSTIIRSFMSSRLLAATWPGISSSLHTTRSHCTQKLSSMIRVDLYC